jgi:hypothetical protein
MMVKMDWTAEDFFMLRLYVEMDWIECYSHQRLGGIEAIRRW